MCTASVSQSGLWMLYASVVGVLSVGVSASTLAEDGDSPELDDERPVEEIVVTGSRIKRTEFSSPSPIMVIDLDVAALAGQADVAEILQESTLGATAPQIDSLNLNSHNRFGGPGANSIDLRGLGYGKTLVLLNGRRLNPAGTRGTVAAVDLNTIPTSIIQRIEILKDGASSVYGSDAVAGVVNITTRRDVEGFAGSLSYGAPFDGGGDTATADLSLGLLGANSSFLFGVEYFERQPLLVGDREWARCTTDFYRDPVTGEDLSRIDPTTGQPKCWNTSAHDYVINYGDFYTTGRVSRSIYDPEIGDWRIGSVAERSWDDPSADHGHVISAVRRMSAFSFGNWAIDALGDGGEAYYELLYNSRRSSQNIGPRQMFLRMEDSPFSPFYNAGGWAFDTPLLLPIEQILGQDVDWYRGIAGLRGAWSDRWSWDLAVGYGRSGGTYSMRAFLADRVSNMLDLVQLSDGSYDCAINQAPVTGDGNCVPINPFQIIRDGLNSPDRFPRDILEYMMTVDTGKTVYTQKTLAAYVSGPLIDLPAGSLEAVIGIEGRRESINDTPGPMTLSGNSYLVPPWGITAGSDSVREIFVELEAPLLKDKPAAQELTINIAGRYSRYDTAGSDTTYRLGLNWQILDWVRFRSSLGTSFRAPALYENYLEGQVSALFFYGDPCLEFRERYAPGDPVYDNCLSELGDADVQVSITTIIRTYGNAGRIEPETSESLTAGLVFEWDSVGLAMALDYFDFTIEGEIDRYGPGIVVRACYELPVEQFRQPGTVCDFVSDRHLDNQVIREINDSYFNINGKYMEGVDLTLRYGLELGEVDFDADLRSTRILEFTQTLTGDVIDDFNGRIGWADLVAQLDLRASFRDWTFYYGLDYIGEQSSYHLWGEDPATSIGVLSTDPVIYHDFGLRYDTGEWTIHFGVQNVADTEPPLVTAPVLGWGNAARNTHYDVLGRSYFIRLSLGF